MGWLEDLANFGAGAVQGVERAQQIASQHERNKILRQEREDRQRKLDEDAKRRSQKSEIEGAAKDDEGNAGPPSRLAGATPNAVLSANGATGAAAPDQRPSDSTPSAAVGRATDLARSYGATPQDSSDGTASRGEKGPPSPVPAVAATNGAQSVQAERVTVTPKAADPLAGLKRRYDMAVKKGYYDLAAEYQSKLTDAISGEVRQQSLLFEQKYAPTIQEIKMAQAEAEQNNLPFRLDADRQKIMDEYAALKRKGVAGAFFDLKSPALRNDALKTLGGAFGLPIADVKMIEKDGQKLYVPIGADGKPFQNGKDSVYFHKDDIDEWVGQALGIEPKYIKLGEGEKLVRTSRAGVDVVAEGNPKAKPGSESQGRLLVNDAVAQVAGAFGARLDPISKMIDQESIKDRAGYEKAIQEVEALVQGGMAPMAAASQIAEKYRRQQALAKTGGAAAPGPDSTAAPWR